MKKECYVSTDIEATGPIPGPYSMISLGSAVVDENEKVLDTFYEKLLWLPGSTMHPSTKLFWDENPEAWEEVCKEARLPSLVMTEYKKWLNRVQSKYGRPVFVAYPAGFDFTYVYWYLHYFTGNCPYSFSCLDIKTLAMAQMKSDFYSSVKRNMPERWLERSKNPHVALDDAISQGILFVRIMKEMKDG